MENIKSGDEAVFDWIVKTNPPGRSRAEIMSNYDSWSSTYDEMLTPERHKGPRVVAEEAARLVPQDRRQEARVLDVAAGTGLVGRELFKKGFKNVDALEPSEGMMQRLKETGVYNLRYQEFIGLGNKVSVPYNTYDVVISCSGIADGRMPLESIEEMIHLTKSGGVLIIISSLHFVGDVGIDLKKLEQYEDLLEQKGLMRKMLKRKITKNFFDQEGVLLSYRVL